MRSTRIHNNQRCTLVPCEHLDCGEWHVNETTSAVLNAPPKTSVVHDKMNRKPGLIPMIIFGIVLVGGIAWAGSQLLGDLFAAGHAASAAAYGLLALALLIALGFEF